MNRFKLIQRWIDWINFIIFIYNKLFLFLIYLKNIIKLFSNTNPWITWDKTSLDESYVLGGHVRPMTTFSRNLPKKTLVTAVLIEKEMFNYNFGYPN